MCKIDKFSKKKKHFYQWWYDFCQSDRITQLVKLKVEATAQNIQSLYQTCDIKWKRKHKFKHNPNGAISS